MTNSAPLLNSTPAIRVDLERYPVLDEKQIGSLRHIGNLSRQPKNDWSHMMGPTAWQEDFGAYRYQLAYMSYALALGHFHRLPAAPGLFRKTFDNLLQKMLLPDVWYEWHDTSRGGGVLNNDMPMTEGWSDPIIKDNIMYSAYLQSMSLLYNVLFDDNKYAAPGSLTLSHNPLFWGGQKGHVFKYDQNSISDRIYWSMVESGYLGVACEPYCVFMACNQPAILGFRLHDVLNGGHRAEEVTKGYLAAWTEFGGFLDGAGHYNTLVRMGARQVVPGHNVWSDAWVGALMNAWNSDFVKKHYPKQRDSWLHTSKKGTAFVRLPRLLRADMPRDALGDFGWFTVWASEMGDTETLNGLLAHADQYMSPEWGAGGYYYPRNDQEYDDNGDLVSVHPILSNAMLPYARLNVADGLRQLYEQPWRREHFLSPSLAEVSFTIDLRRAVYDGTAGVLVFDARNQHAPTNGEIEIANVFGRGDWTLTCNGNEIVSSSDAEVTGRDGRWSTRRIGDRLLLAVGHSDWASYVLAWS